MFFTVASPLAQPEWKAVCVRTLPRPDFELLDLHGGVLVLFPISTQSGWPPQRQRKGARRGPPGPDAR